MIRIVIGGVVQEGDTKLAALGKCEASSLFLIAYRDKGLIICIIEPL